MKPRASFAWRRLRRLEFGLDSCSTFGAVDWYLKATYLACPPFGAELEKSDSWLTYRWFWQQLPCAIAQLCGVSACMHDAVTLQRAMYRGGRASERDVEPGPEGF